jgi:cytochrome bd-type quinol oxidase subunit 2
MSMIRIVTIGFLILEATNVIALYFFPGTRLANGVGVFKAWEKSKDDPEIHNFVKYLVNWVAGTKLIFILLLIVILYTADDQTLLLTGAAMVFSIGSFFWRLFPLIRKMDKDSQIEPKNYSVVLGWMILVFILIFLTAVLLNESILENLMPEKNRFRNLCPSSLSPLAVWTSSAVSCTRFC